MRGAGRLTFLCENFACVMPFRNVNAVDCWQAPSANPPVEPSWIYLSADRDLAPHASSVDECCAELQSVTRCLIVLMRETQQAWHRL